MRHYKGNSAATALDVAIERKDGDMGTVSLRKLTAAFLAAMLAACVGGVAFAQKAFAADLSAGQASALAAQAVKVKASYKETFVLKDSSHKATFTMSTKKVLRKTADGRKMYQVTLKKYVSKNKKYDAEVPAIVDFTDKRFGKDSTAAWEKWPSGNVTGIAPGAFKSCKSTTLSIWSLRLTKKGVKNSLKGSKITTVEVPKELLKTYKRYFTKANCGKKVKVVAFSGDYADYPDGGANPYNSLMNSYWLGLDM